jgi:diguanylate cyclase (GGDEF)-like protein
MQTVVLTLLFGHDLRLVALAALVDALSAFAGITLLNHARRTDGLMKYAWVGVAAVSVGFGIWATHFVAMIAFHPGVPVGYDLPLTLLSLVVAILIVGGGIWFATIGHRRSDFVLGGAIVGIGIASMHYVGMAALRLGGIMWDPYLVASSILLGMSFGGAALYVGTRGSLPRWRVGGTLLLVLAIVAMHFTAMGAAGIENCYAVVAAGDQTPVWLSLVAALASILILLFALGATYLDLRDRKRDAAEVGRMRGLADAAVEGLLVTSGEVIVTANESFTQLIGVPQTFIAGRHLRDFLSPAVVSALVERPNAAIETELTTGSGSTLTIEAILREVDFGGTPHQAIAIRDLSARKKAENHIRFLAHNDALTGLPNRASFGRTLESEIAHARRHNQKFAVLGLDLDRFKEVNDLFGHPAGDALLQRVGQALLAATEGQGNAARLGGDEFAVLLTDVGTPGRAGRLAEQILDAFRLDNERSTTGTVIGASIGIALFPDNGESAEQLISHADTALYRAKQDGRGIYRFYENAMGAAVRDRRLVEHDLRHAISRNQLHLVYQPQVDIQTSEVTGFEALVRWNHPERGHVSPADFVPIAEEGGLILQIGEWVLRTACAEAAKWRDHLTVAVNVSGVQLHSPAFAHVVHEVLTETGLDPSRLEIEITETALVRDMVRAVSTLRQIKALGVEIAMDDFGTGYSSLANLRAFPFSKIKVDQSFIRLVDSNEQSAAIVRAVLGLGSGLNLPVVAEGVERPEELEFLRGEICAAAQGYLLSRPEDISHFADIISGSSRKLEEALVLPLKMAG